MTEPDPPSNPEAELDADDQKPHDGPETAADAAALIPKKIY